MKTLCKHDGSKPAYHHPGIITTDIFRCNHCLAVIEYSNLDIWYFEKSAATMIDCPECNHTRAVRMVSPYKVPETIVIPDDKSHINRKAARRRKGKV